jgi:uncharacterized protein YegP (UPF0339 family)
MTRYTQLTRAVDAAREARTAPGAPPEPALMKFRVFEDNGGAYYWTIVSSSGETLTRSASFATYEDAQSAARVVHAGAASASLEHLVGDTQPVDSDAPVDLAARRKTAVVRDDLDAERWLDEGGSFGSEVVTRWPAPR